MCIVRYLYCSKIYKLTAASNDNNNNNNTLPLLPAWNEGGAKEKIINFVKNVIPYKEFLKQKKY